MDSVLDDWTKKKKAWKSGESKAKLDLPNRQSKDDTEGEQGQKLAEVAYFSHTKNGGEFAFGGLVVDCRFLGCLFDGSWGHPK
jgi:hypothetical protein